MAVDLSSCIGSNAPDNLSVNNAMRSTSFSSDTSSAAEPAYDDDSDDVNEGARIEPVGECKAASSSSGKSLVERGCENCFADV